MRRQMVYCRCGQRVKTPDVLRTDFYERSNGAEYVYIKYRCRHCKRISEAFIPEHLFSWDMFKTPRDEMSDEEREDFAVYDAISSADVVDFHQFLKGDAPLSALSSNQSESIRNNNGDLPKEHKPLKARDDINNK